MKSFIIFIFIFPISVLAQNSFIDSLKVELKNAKHDTTRCSILNLLSENASEEEWPEYNEQLLKLAEKSVTKANVALKPIYLKHLGVALNNAGYLATNKGDIPKALEYLHRSLKIQEEVNDKKGVASSLINIGFIYDGQGDNQKAIDYNQRSLVILYEIKDKELIGSCLNNIGNIYQKQGDLDKALVYFQKGLKARQQQADKMGIANSINNIGLIYYKEKDHTKALEYFHQSLKIAEELSDKRGISLSTNLIATALQDFGKIKEAQKYSIWSLTISKELGYPENIRRAAMRLKEIYKSQDNFKNALEMYELERLMRDSIYNTESRRASIKKQLQYQYEKKAAADSVKHDEEQKVKNALLTAQRAQLKQEKTQRLALYGGLVLVIAFLGFVFNRFRVARKQKVIIEQQKVLVDEAFTHLEEKNKEVMDSIHYAKRIQTALLTSEKYIERKLNELN